MHTQTTTDLIYAAFLMCLGAEIEAIEDCGRFSKIKLAIPHSCLGKLTDKAERLHKVASRAENEEELEFIFSRSILNDVSLHYFSLKRRVASKRKGKK